MNFVRLDRIAKIARHIKHDFDTWEGEDVPSAAEPSPRQLGAMFDILKLPVAAWNDPGCVAGEIDTEARRNT